MSYDYRDEVEIDLIDLLHYLLLKWRVAFAFMLIGMLAMGIYGYYKKVPVVINDKGELVTPIDESSLAVLGKKLTTNEKLEAVNAVETYLGYEKNYESRSSLKEKSIVFQYDAYHVPNYVYTYKISDFNDDNVPNESTVTNVDNIVNLYKNAIYDSSVIKEIKSANGWEYDDGFVMEIYGCNKTGLDIMTVWANAPSKKECEAIIKILDKKINEVVTFVQNQYEHNISKVQSTYYESYNVGTLDQQKAYNDTLIGIEKSMQQVSSAMNADQKAYYAALLKTVKEESQNAEEADPLAIAKRETAEEASLTTDATTEGASASVSEKAEESEQNVVMVPSNSLNVKMILIGALAGLFLILCVYGILYVMSPKIKSRRDITDMFKLSVFGVVRDENRYNKFFSGVDRFIDALFEVHDGNLSAADAMDITISSIELGIKRNGYKSLYITSVGNFKRTEEFKKNLKIGLEEKSGIEGIEYSTGPSPLFDAESLEKLYNSNAVVLVEEAGKSRYDGIAKMLEICDKFGIIVLGTVVLE
ncbi:hypothetical protein SAMN04487928_101169 [Butyrivibrio proteoclasticus]|uniref:Capsular polysaccharide biosynthesis protein n=1 Tax=Butyrivibrio proteoclasticus TaxID=43305 RepID=A0A1I5PWE1_9FIRM|nr:hypothetical protein [Butyrivibrio proteoclasticus]SFP38140.1 hypothetical protein SAMN04487928_101169 [Butyrivibrio proteoclasticus]